MMAPEGAVIGIDVGCSPTRRSSAIGLLRWTKTTVSLSIERFRAVEPERGAVISSMIGGHEIEAAAVDGSMRRGFDIIGRYRTAERMLTRRLWPLIGKPGQSSTPVGKLLNHHANKCVRHVLDTGMLWPASHAVAIDAAAVVEAFPSAFLGMMIADPVSLRARRADRSDLFFSHLAAEGSLSAMIAHFLPGRRLAFDPAAITNHDDRAAFVCAVTALCVAGGNFVAVGDPVDGWIIMPPRPFIQPAQWELLNLNAEAKAEGALYVAQR
jgi:hypothetical protein